MAASASPSFGKLRFLVTAKRASGYPLRLFDLSENAIVMAQTGSEDARRRLRFPLRLDLRKAAPPPKDVFVPLVGAGCADA
jgi:hypothetical protein